MPPSRQGQAAGRVLQPIKIIHILIHTIMFFTTIHQMMTDGVDLTLVIRKANGQLTVSTLPKSNGLKDEAQNHIVPLTVSGLPQELDAGFLQAIARPIQKAAGLRQLRLLQRPPHLLRGVFHQGERYIFEGEQPAPGGGYLWPDGGSTAGGLPPAPRNRIE